MDNQKAAPAKNNQQQENKMLVKTFYTHFSMGGDVLKGWSAVKISNENDYLITRVNGSTIQLRAGEIVPNIGEPMSFTDTGHLKIAGRVVLCGENILHGWVARKTSKPNEYLITGLSDTDKVTRKKIKIGETYSGLGVFSGLDEYNNLIIGGRSIPQETKEYELRLLVLNQKVEGYNSGYLAYFNKVENGSEDNNKNGIKGVFYPARKPYKGKNGSPATFMELVGDNEAYKIATFWPSNNGYLNVSYRNLSSAIEERLLYQRVAELRSMANESGVDPSEIFGYSEAVQNLEKANKQGLISAAFYCMTGKEFFEITAQQPQETNQYSS